MSRSTAWSRLKPIQQDPLEAVGLLSKGDTKLLNPKFQETYFAKILPRYMDFCAVAGRDTDALDRAFASLSINDTPSNHGSLENSNPRNSSGGGSANPERSKELSILLMAMRKLREGIVASKRVDGFAAGAYMFIIRAAILTSTFESYHPALLHLLNVIHARSPLTNSELHEFIGYHILDLACRTREFSEAFKVRNRWRYRDERVESIVLAAVRDDWITFWRLREQIDGYQRALVGWIEEDLRKHALKCLAKTYFTVEKGYVEKCGGRKWDDLKALNGVGWELEGNKVIIRKVKSKT